jgi:hypothetical protein
MGMNHFLSIVETEIQEKHKEYLRNRHISNEDLRQLTQQAISSEGIVSYCADGQSSADNSGECSADNEMLNIISSILMNDLSIYGKISVDAIRIINRYSEDNLSNHVISPVHHMLSALDNLRR